jgi:Ulp1 family protease
MKRGKQRFGAVFNLDKHDQPGSHWVSLFICVPKKTIVFFDSANGGVPAEIRKFVKHVLNQDGSYQFIASKKEHQKKDTECGMYSIHFIVEMLNDYNKMLDLVLRGSIPDSKMIRYRKKYFNRPKTSM